MVTRTNGQGLANLILATIVWILFLLALAAILGSRKLFSQSAGAIRTQEIYSSTHHVKVDNSINTPVVAVTYAASTTFDANLGEHFTETLTGNVTSSTLSNAVAGANYFFSICQDATGNRTFAWPSNFQNAPTIVATASKCTNVVGFYDGTNFDITGQWNTASGGAGTGTVTSVGMTMPGTIFNSSVSGSPITTSGTLAPSLVPVQSGYVLAGPVAAQGSNVAVRQTAICHSTTANATCTLNSVVSGDGIMIVSGTQSYWSLGTADTLGTTFTDYGGSSTTHRAFGIASSSGNDTITLSGTRNGTSGDNFLIVDLTGVSSYNDANSAVTQATLSGGFGSISHSVTPSAATDAYLVVAETDSTNFPSTGMTINPSSTMAGNFNSTSGSNYNTGIVALNAPGTLSSVNYTSTFSGSGTAHATQFALGFSQSASASSAPPAYRALQEGDLPPSAISALQSVQTFNMSATTTVIDPTTPNTGTSLISGTLAMPSQGCPCRVLAYYSVYWDETGSGDTFDFWLSDGTNQFATAERNVVSAAGPGVNSSGISPVSYANNQSVTFTLYGASGTAATGTARKAAANTVATQLSHITLAIAQSRN